MTKLAVIELDKPEKMAIPPGVEVLELRAYSGADIDRIGVEVAIHRQPWRLQVQQLNIWIDQLESCWPALQFPNIWSLVAAGKKLTNLEDIRQLQSLRALEVAPNKKTHIEILPTLTIKSLSMYINKASDEPIIGMCKRLDELGVGRWQSETLHALESLRLCKATFGRGKLVSTEGLNGERLEQLRVVVCRRLRSFSGLRCRSIFIQSCPHIDRNTFGDVEDLRDLHIESSPPIEDMAFVTKCKQLESLSVTACRKVTDDVSWIAKCHSLRDVWLPVRDSVVRELSRRNPQVAVANHRITVCGGIEKGR